MDDSSLQTPLPFLRNRRALLIDDQVWFLLSNLCRVTGNTHEDRLAMRLADDQIRQERLLTEDGLELVYVLLSESAVYQAMVLFNVPDYGVDQRHRRAAGARPAQRQRPAPVELQFERQRLRLLDWQDDLWVRFGDRPRVLGGRSRIAGLSGWRGWANRLRT